MRTKLVSGLAVVVAMFLLVTNPLVADAARQITGKQIKNNSVTGKDVKDGSLSRDFGASELPTAADRRPDRRRSHGRPTGATAANSPTPGSDRCEAGRSRHPREQRRRPATAGADQDPARSSTASARHVPARPSSSRHASVT